MRIWIHPIVVTCSSKTLRAQQRVDQICRQEDGEDGTDEVFKVHRNLRYRRSQPRTYAQERAKNPRTVATRIRSVMKSTPVLANHNLTSSAAVIRFSDFRRSGAQSSTIEPGGPVLPPGGVTP